MKTDAVVKAESKLTLLVMAAGKLVEITADFDEPTKGLVVNKVAKAKYKNIARK